MSESEIKTLQKQKIQARKHRNNVTTMRMDGEISAEEFEERKKSIYS